MLGCGKLEELVLENMKVYILALSAGVLNATNNIILCCDFRSKHDSVAQR